MDAKVDKLSKKNRRRPIWDAKSCQFVEKNPPEAKMSHQSYTNKKNITKQKKTSKIILKFE